MKQGVFIVIPTFHRKTNLLQLLNSLKHDSSKITIVEQGGNNRQDYKKYITNYIFIRKPSTPHALNVGVYKAQEEFVLFLDDDVTVNKYLIKYHLDNFLDNKVAATVGRIITDGQKIEPDRNDVGRINSIGIISDGFSSTIKQEVDTVIGANTCWRKKVIDELGGFDERFTGNAIRFESDMSLRAKKMGYKIIFEPKAVVYHHRAETGGARKSEGRIQWYFDFFSNETYFFLKHFNNLLLPIFLATKLAWALRCMFGFGREVSVRSMTTPVTGIIDGIKKYYDYRR
jgi:GT2 family glycosyltransferase